MIKTKTINNVVAVGDRVKKHCCPGHDWTVTLILNDTIWGVCSNPDCSVGIQSDGDIDNDFYRGVSTVSLQDLAVWLEEPCA